jgi:hypothetical protein
MLELASIKLLIKKGFWWTIFITIAVIGFIVAPILKASRSRKQSIKTSNTNRVKNNIQSRNAEQQFNEAGKTVDKERAEE